MSSSTYQSNVVSSILKKTLEIHKRQLVPLNSYERYECGCIRCHHDQTCDVSRDVDQTSRIRLGSCGVICM